MQLVPSFRTLARTVTVQVVVARQFESNASEKQNSVCTYARHQFTVHQKASSWKLVSRRRPSKPFFVLVMVL